MSQTSTPAARLTRGHRSIRLLWTLIATLMIAETLQASSSTSVSLQVDYTATVEYTDGHGTADALVLPMPSVPSTNHAAFRFRDPRHAEVLMQLLDGCSINGHYWFFSASLTDTAYTIRLESAGGTTRTYENPAGARSGFADVTSFPCPPRGATSLPPVELATGSAPVADFGLEASPARGFFCVPDADTACLFGTNFPVEVEFTTTGASGDGLAHSPNPAENTALFGLFESDLPDVAIKMVRTCGHYEVHWAQLGNITLDIEVVSFISGLTWNSGPTTVNGVDREAFVIDADCLFAGSFELGDRFEWSASSP